MDPNVKTIPKETTKKFLEYARSLCADALNGFFKKATKYPNDVVFKLGDAYGCRAVIEYTRKHQLRDMEAVFQMYAGLCCEPNVVIDSSSVGLSNWKKLTNYNNADGAVCGTILNIEDIAQYLSKERGYHCVSMCPVALMVFREAMFAILEFAIDDYEASVTGEDANRIKLDYNEYRTIVAEFVTKVIGKYERQTRPHHSDACRGCKSTDQYCIDATGTLMRAPTRVERVARMKTKGRVPHVVIEPVKLPMPQPERPNMVAPAVLGATAGVVLTSMYAPAISAFLSPSTAQTALEYGATLFQQAIASVPHHL